MKIEEFPHISIIVIGYNEEENLVEVFNAILNLDYPEERLELIYVDSGSTDRSVEIARQFTEKIFIESSIFPTAARNRNRGLIEANHEICHFIDGDIIIDKDYLKFAVERLLKDDVHCVFGRLIEKEVKGIGKILLHDYSNRKPGFIDAPGAGGTFKKQVLIEINGWDERIPRGEETELGERFRKAGYKILFLNVQMGIHDYGISNLWGFCIKQIKEGESFGAVSLIESNENFFKNSRRLNFNNYFLHFIFVIYFIICVYYLSWYLFLISLIFLFLSYNIFLFVKYYFKRKIRNSNSLKYLFLINYTRSLTLIGSLSFFIKYMFYSTHVKKTFHKKVEILNEINVCKQKENDY